MNENCMDENCTTLPHGRKMREGVAFAQASVAAQAAGFQTGSGKLSIISAVSGLSTALLSTAVDAK